MENLKERVIILRIAREGLDIADRCGWGLGECRYNMNESAMFEIDDCDAYDLEKSAEQCKNNHEAHMKEARRIGNLAYQKACSIEDANKL